jgi:hypothetical protein
MINGDYFLIYQREIFTLAHKTMVQEAPIKHLGNAGISLKYLSYIFFSGIV